MAATDDLERRARALHRRATVVDCLDVSRHDAPHWRRMRDGGVTAANVTITLGDGFVDTCRLIAELNDRVAAHPDLVRPVRAVADIAAAKAEGRVGLIYGFQNASPIEADLRFVQVFADLGVRIVQLTYMSANLLGDGCLETRNGGLTDFGRAAVAELNRRRLLIDLSHVGARSSLEAIERSATPVAITHACAAALRAHPRNKDDAVIRALAARGGVIGVTSLAEFVADDWRQADLGRFCDHVDYVVRLVGVQHVGVGLDLTEDLPDEFLMPAAWGGTNPGRRYLYDGGWQMPIAYARGIAASDQLPAVTAELLRRGYADDDVAAILGGNWLRLFGEVWGA